MPSLGMIMTEGTLAKWLKSPSDVVHQGDPLAEIATDKINYELEAPAGGIFHPVAQEGEVILVEGLIGYLLEEGEPVPELPAPQASPSQDRSLTTTTTESIFRLCDRRRAIGEARIPSRAGVFACRGATRDSVVVVVSDLSWEGDA